MDSEASDWGKSEKWEGRCGKFILSYFVKCFTIRGGAKSDCIQSRVISQREAIREGTIENAGDRGSD